MKRSWLGFVLLIVLLALSLIASWAMDEIHEEAADTMDEAASLALAGNWSGAAYLTAKVRHTWEKWDLLRSALADHTPMEEIEGMFAALEIYGASRDRIAFAALCRELARMLEAMGEAHRLQLHNLL